MVIKKIEIYNFRIFYKENVFELTNGLNLILGWHGDGKTTFFDALEWLFRTDGTRITETNFIPKKRIEELSSGDSDNVRVAMTYEHNGKIKVLEKSFLFTKSFDGEVSTSNYTFTLIEHNGVESDVNEGSAFDKDLPPEIRKFIMFCGGGELGMLQSSNALKSLVENFSDVKDFEVYFSFIEYATMNAEKARDYALKIEKKNTDRIKQLTRTLENERAALAEIESEIHLKESEAVNYDNLLKSIEQGNEASILLVSVNERINRLSQRLSETKARIKESYSRYLLEDMWVLLGFDTIAEEYLSKVNSYDRIRRRIENEYLIEEGAKTALSVLKSESNEYKEIKPLFRNNYVQELRKHELHLSDISKSHHKIQDAIALNERLHEEVKKIDSNLAIEHEHKKRILAQMDGLSEEQLLANYNNISDWMNKRNQAINRIEILKRQRERHKATLEEVELSLSRISEGTDAEKYSKIALMFHHIADAFTEARGVKIERSIMMIEDKANMFLYQLLPEDFTGTIRIIEKQNGQGEIFLIDDDGNRIFYPDNSLWKNTIFAIMLALGEVISEINHMDYPLVFDGTLSAYGSEYGNPIIDSVNRQMIVMTSDFIIRDAKRMRVVDIEALPSKIGNVYYMEKQVPFDSKKLSTLQIAISKIK